jgi:hypothetical protein
LRFPSDLETKSSHATLVLVDYWLAIGGGISCLGEQHALVPFRLLVFAHTAGLSKMSIGYLEILKASWQNRTLGLEVSRVATGLESDFEPSEATAISEQDSGNGDSGGTLRIDTAWDAIVMRSKGVIGEFCELA